MKVLNEYEIEITEVPVSKDDFDRRLVNLIGALLALDEELPQEEIEPIQEAA